MDTRQLAVSAKDREGSAVLKEWSGEPSRGDGANAVHAAVMLVRPLRSVVFGSEGGRQGNPLLLDGVGARPLGRLCWLTTAR